MSNNTPGQLWESKVIKFPIFSGGNQNLLTWLDKFDKAYIANYVSECICGKGVLPMLFDYGMTQLNLGTRSFTYLNDKFVPCTNKISGWPNLGPANKDLFIDRLRSELREPVEMECSMTIQKALKKAKAAEAAYSGGGPLSLYLLKRSYLSREGSANKEIGELKKAISDIAQKVIDPSNSILDQPIPDDVQPALTLNSKIETLDVSLIEKIRKKINKPSTRNLIDIHGQKKCPLGIVKNLPIVVNKVEIPIDVEDKKYQMPITYWKRITYNLEKPVPLEKKQMLEEVNLKDLQHGWKEIETLESLVEDLDKELGIKKVASKVNKLEKKQQIQVEELIEKK
ncbi:9565_t:CDS:2 [Gigaspora margarita]|uniref:9565_t:CDS:1 n=1 Tax=Gigaspora margarita TaxID=4874 RepID=A0ABN7VLG0_GIGMA|nr:9565_t:CDS:2 [Gigaspora margarita]